LILCTFGAAQAESRKIVGYYWGKGRPGYQVSQIPVQELARLIYSRAMPNAQGDCVFPHPDVDVPNLAELKTLRVRNPHLYILLSVGGWSGSEFFSDVALLIQRGSNSLHPALRSCRSTALTAWT